MINQTDCFKVFLRVLEYYEGILFLTTNRVGSVDEAFKSRIHMALYYPSLDLQKTVQIWRSQIKRVKLRGDKNVEIDEDKIIAFAIDLFHKPQPHNGNALRWNGRQIRNAFQSSLAIAEYAAGDGIPAKLEISHFEKVAKASSEFDHYLSRVHHGRSDADNAYSNMARYDDFEASPIALNPMQQPMASQYQTRADPGFGAARAPTTHSSMPQYAQAMNPQQGYPAYGVTTPQYSPAGSMQRYPQPTNNMQGYSPQQMMSTPTRQPQMQSNMMLSPGIPMQPASVQMQQGGVPIQQMGAQQSMPGPQQANTQSQPQQLSNQQGLPQQLNVQPQQLPIQQAQPQQGFGGEGYRYV